MSENPKLYEFMRPIVTHVINFLYTPQYINTENIPKEGGAVLAGNHKFYFDPLLVDINSKRCIYSMMWYEYFDIFPKFFKGLGTIRVKPHESNSLQQAIDHLKHDDLINIFPEGEMNKTDEILLPFKKGAVAMAQEAKVDIVPFVIVGDYKFRSKNLKLIVGEPLNVLNMSFEQAQTFLYNTIKQMLIKYQ